MLQHKPLEVKVKTKEKVDERIKIFSEAIFSIAAFLIFVPLSTFFSIPKATPVPAAAKDALELKYGNAKNIPLLGFIAQDYPALGETKAVTAGIADNDGNNKVVVASYYQFQNYVSIYNGQNMELQQILNLSSDPEEIMLVDLNNDQLLDIVTSLSYQKKLGIALNSSKGYEQFYYLDTFDQMPFYLASDDFDQDGCQDLAFTS